MNKRIFLLVVALLAIVFVAAPAPLAARQTPPTPQAAPAVAPTPPAAQKPTPAAATPGNTYPNVRFEVTITDQASGGPAIKKTMSVVASRRGSVRSGVNVPIASTTFGAVAQGGVNTVPISSYTYRTMGLNLDVRDVYLSGSTGLIRADLSLEYNPIDEATEKNPVSASAPVSFSNFSQSFTLELESGKPLLVAQTSDPVPGRNRMLSVEVKATVVK